jgi:hypothetical protein
MSNQHPNGTYTLEISVRNVVGSGKASVRQGNNAWTNLFTFDSDGTYSGTYTGEIRDINVGANGDTTFEADFDYVSLTLSTGTQVLDLDGDGNIDTLIASDGNVTITEDIDSVNIDLDGDLQADIVLPKP